MVVFLFFFSIEGFSLGTNRDLLCTFPLQRNGFMVWKRFPRYWPFVGGIHWSQVGSGRFFSQKNRQREDARAVICCHCNEGVHNGLNVDHVFASAMSLACNFAFTLIGEHETKSHLWPLSLVEILSILFFIEYGVCGVAFKIPRYHETHECADTDFPVKLGPVSISEKTSFRKIS